MKEEDHILIQKYFDGILSGAELEKFNTRLNKDKAFKKEYNTYALMYEYVEKKNNHEVGLKALKKFKDEKSSETMTLTPPKKLNKNWLYVLLAILTLAYVVFLFIEPETEERKSFDLYFAYFDAEPISVQTKGSQELINKEILAAHEKYNQGEFTEAAQKFSSVANALNRPSQLAFAISLMKIDQELGAEHLLIKIEDSPAFKNASLWYKALMYLKKNDLQGCKLLLNQIEAGSSYEDKAKRLLIDLEN